MGIGPTPSLGLSTEPLVGDDPLADIAVKHWTDEAALPELAEIAAARHCHHYTLGGTVGAALVYPVVSRAVGPHEVGKAAGRNATVVTNDLKGSLLSLG